ncbi:MAG TPA: phosphotransferase [Stellaceae bacterium]|nr:phosphotransferase [Stellaceae bacterium]
MIDREAISRLIPHAGAMCLLDEVMSWDNETIRCRSIQHRAASNPLRRAGRLGALSGIEFAAQAMAAHGRLAGAIGERPRMGFIASLRDIVCRCERLDQFDDDLIVKATRLMGDDARVVYAFTVDCGAREILSGRATVILQAEMPP